MRYHEKLLLAAIPFSAVRHTGDKILLATKRACSEMGIGSFVESPNELEVIDTVTSCVHSTASDSASNIVCGWKEFDGHECNCHILALSLEKYLESPGEAVQLYDVEHPKKASTSVDNPDGSKYGDHQLCGVDWDIGRESCFVLQQHAVAIDLLQVTLTPTVSTVLPIIEALTGKLEDDYPSKYDGEPVSILNTDVQEARKRYRNNLKKEVGTLTKDTVLEWARAAYDVDWKPKAVAAPIQVVGSVAAASKPKKMLVTFMSDSEDEDDDVVAPSDTYATQATGEDVDEFSLYSTLKPCKKCEDPLECMEDLLTQLHWKGNEDGKLQAFSK
ncbi:hypothetical protein CYMTET_50044 [Cymbomonas tetramitiformis]|uniref:Uncharacterized protein n=1 Tax=Cymbomonas tetramitiformis TaxID=36881 RepID=A0AAE0BQ46_9CHLO|nr:hypothetical protein CYMTET_50044 [Cymbomonas tetramitiformis]